MKTSFFALVFYSVFITSCTKPENIIPFNREGKWGLINNKGEVVLTPKYRQIDFSNFGKDLELIKITDSLGKTGYIDLSGNEVIPPKYVVGTNFMNGFAFVCSDGAYPTMIDKTGNETEIEGLMMASKFQNGFAVIQKARRFGYLNYWRPTKFRSWKLIGLEMSIWKFPCISLGDVSLMVQKGGSFQKGVEMFILS